MACRYLFTNLREYYGRYYEDDIVEESPMDVYTEDNFRIEFRMSKAEIINICDIVKDEMYTKGCRKMDLSIEEKVLISIKTLALGSFQNCSKDFTKVSQPTVSNTLQAFTDCLTKKAKQFIYMPRNRAEEEAIKSKFYGIAGFPSVLGFIDGTHIPIIAISREECAYINRKIFARSTCKECVILI